MSENKQHPFYYFWDESSREVSESLKGKKWVVDKKAPRTKFGGYQTKLVGYTRPKKIHKKFKKLSQDEVNVMIENLIDSLPEHYICFSKEKLSRIFLIPQHQIHQALDYLNKKGKIHKPSHGIPHDNKRERKHGIGWGGFDGWGMDAYFRMTK